MVGVVVVVFMFQVLQDQAELVVVALQELLTMMVIQEQLIQVVAVVVLQEEVQLQEQAVLAVQA
jgi:hypothetical protein